MENEWVIKWSKPTCKKGLPPSALQEFKLLSKSWDERTESRTELLCKFSYLYRINNLPFEAIKIIEEILASEIGKEFFKPWGYMELGKIMERTGDFESAVHYYSEALNFIEPYDDSLNYYANNNLGYSLNQLGRYTEAEPYCRTAITVNPQLHNAYKNLGVSLEGQGKFGEAVDSYIASTQINSFDTRAFHHLQEMLLKHPETSEKIPDLDFKVSNLEAAIANRNVDHSSPRRKHKGRKLIIEKMLQEEVVKLLEENLSYSDVTDQIIDDLQTTGASNEFIGEILENHSPKSIIYVDGVGFIASSLHHLSFRRVLRRLNGKYGGNKTLRMVWNWFIRTAQSSGKEGSPRRSRSNKSGIKIS